MTRFEVLTLLLTVVSILLIPTLALIIRITRKWTRVEDRLDRVVKDLDKLVTDKDKVHAAIIATMKHDREVMDRRVVWLERNIWSRGQRRREESA
jgi:hypothetical protein